MHTSTRLPRVSASLLALLSLSACDAAHWNYTECEQQADKDVRAVTSLERRQECNSPQQCAAVDKARAAVNETRRAAQVFVCMQSREFAFDSDDWTRDQKEKRERPPYVYWRANKQAR